MMPRGLHSDIRLAAFLVALGSLVVVTSVDAVEPRADEFFTRYCLDCHNDEKAKGDLNLMPALAAKLDADPWLWQDIRDQIDSEEMPPEDPLPDADEKRGALEWIDASLARVDWSAHRRPGGVTVARLTRAEYRYTLRDLLGIDLHAGERLSRDGEGASGFSNDRESLGLSPTQLEAYFGEAERLTDAVFALYEEPQRWRFSATAMADAAGHGKRFEEGAMLVHPGDQIQAEIAFPVDGYYRFEFGVRAFGKPSVIEVGWGGETVAAARVSSPRREKVAAVGFVRAGTRTVSVQSRNLVPQTPLPGDVSQRVQDLGNARGARLGALAENETDEQRKAREALNERAAAIQEAYEWLRILGPGADSREIDRFRKYALERDAGTEGARDRMAAALELSRGDFDVLWEKHNAEVLADNRRLLEAVAHVQWGDWQDHQGKIVADWMEVIGPVEDGGGLLVAFDAASGEVPKRFVERAFRRPIDNAELARYNGVRRRSLEQGESPSEALKLALTAVLVSPEFLFHHEGVGVPDGDDEASGGLGFALASRLSYFLWQSMPDEELFSLAAEGRLQEPEVLQEQLERMVMDRKADAFFFAFAEEWLGLAALGRGVGADPNRYPEFTPELAEAMHREAMLWFRHVMREDLDLLSLIDAEETFLNERLARHYGIDGVEGGGMRLVALDERRRGGVLGMAGVLTATSAPTRAHPSRRGTWVLETLLGLQQGEPLADAGELPGDAGEGRGRTLREELDLHRTKAECAHCHDVIDPVGLGLQGFDGIGRWRELEAGAAVDDRGQLPDGEAFDGPVELKQAVLGRREEVLRQLSRRMLAFALGRQVTRHDRAEVERITEAVMAKNGSAHALLEAVITSPLFLNGEVGAEAGSAAR